MPDTISAAIRAAAEREGLGIEQYRRKHDLPNKGYYALLRNRLPAKVSTREAWFARLRSAGVKLPRALAA